MPEHPPPNLADFLLARTADRIADARQVQASAVTRGIEPDDPSEPALRLARWAIADCEAVRRIVEMRHRLEHPGRGLLAHRPGDPAIAQTLVDVYKHLAHPYSNHPDFQPEWRLS